MLNIFHIFFVQKPVLKTRFSGKNAPESRKALGWAKKFFYEKIYFVLKKHEFEDFFFCKIYEFKDFLISGWVRSFHFTMCRVNNYHDFRGGLGQIDAPHCA